MTKETQTFAGEDFSGEVPRPSPDGRRGIRVPEVPLVPS